MPAAIITPLWRFMCRDECHACIVSTDMHAQHHDVAMYMA
jgi:hypothetical protein